MPSNVNKTDALQRMRESLDILGTEDGEDIATDTALKACKKTLMAIMLSLELTIPPHSEPE